MDTIKVTAVEVYLKKEFKPKKTGLIMRINKSSQRLDSLLFLLMPRFYPMLKNDLLGR